MLENMEKEKKKSNTYSKDVYWADVMAHRASLTPGFRNTRRTSLSSFVVGLIVPFANPKVC